MDEVRLLAKRGGYTDKAWKAMDPSEPEAVSKADQERISLDAARNWPHLNALQRGARAADSIDVRLRKARAQAKHLRIDVHRELRLCRLALEGGRSHAHVERRVEALENRLWPDRGTLPPSELP